MTDSTCKDCKFPLGKLASTVEESTFYAVAIEGKDGRYRVAEVYTSVDRAEMRIRQHTKDIPVILECKPTGRVVCPSRQKGLCII